MPKEYSLSEAKALFSALVQRVRQHGDAPRRSAPSFAEGHSATGALDRFLQDRDA